MTLKKKRKIFTWKNVIICVLIALAAVVLAGYAVFHHYYSLLDHYDPDDHDYVGAVLTEESGLMAADGSAETAMPHIDIRTDEDAATETADGSGPHEEIEERLLANLRQMEESSFLYETDAFNLLLIGIDAREDSFSGNSDAMILLSINRDTKKVVMTSLLRDIYVSIPGHGNNRLNHAYLTGGMSLLTQTIQNNLGIHVDRCVVINFYLMMDLVDALGGLDLDVSADEIRVMNMYIRNHNRMLEKPLETDVLSEADAGLLHADGSQTLAYTRVRYVGTDFARTGRQRIVISKCLEKIKDMNLGELMALAERFLPEVRTDLTQSDCASLLLMLLRFPDYQIETMTIPREGTYQYAEIRNMSVLTIDFQKNTEEWHKLVEGH